jgi:hypothetical protein
VQLSDETNAERQLVELGHPMFQRNDIVPNLAEIFRATIHDSPRLCGQ